jgi:hypothetical protein
MSVTATTTLYSVQDVPNSDYGQTNLPSIVGSFNHVHVVTMTPSSQAVIPPSTTISSIQAPELLASKPTHQTSDIPTVPAITAEMQKRERWVLSAMSFALFMAGWNDGTLGPLLPRIQEWYGVSISWGQFFPLLGNTRPRSITL